MKKEADIQRRIKEEINELAEIDHRIRVFVFILVIAFVLFIVLFILLKNKIYSYISLIVAVINLIAAIINYAAKNDIIGKE